MSGASPAPGVTPARAMRRPALVSFLAILNLLGAAAFLAAAIALVAEEEGTVARVAVTVVLLFLAGLLGACGWGLWRLVPRGRILQIVFSFLGLLVFPVGTVISILLLVYFFKPGARILFSRRPPSGLTPEEVAAVFQVTGGGRALTAVIIVITVVSVAAGGAVAYVAAPNLLNAIQRAYQRRTIERMEAVGALLERYKKEKGYYPEVRTMEELSGVYPEAEHLRKDGWDHEYRISSTIEGWVLASAGRDGRWEQEDLGAYQKGTSQTYDSDIVLSDRGFTQSPEKMPR